MGCIFGRRHEDLLIALTIVVTQQCEWAAAAKDGTRIVDELTGERAGKRRIPGLRLDEPVLAALQRSDVVARTAYPKQWRSVLIAVDKRVAHGIFGVLGKPLPRPRQLARYGIGMGTLRTAAVKSGSTNSL